MNEPMNIVFVGCGYVSSFYARTLPNHPQLNLLGAFDAVDEHSEDFCVRYEVMKYSSFDEVLQDPKVNAIINLTNPKSHFEISLAALESGKHVYSEKPLAIDLDDARRLAQVATERGLQLCSAPCNVLSETAQTIWRSVRDGLIGRVRLVYAELDDGMIHRLPYESWRNELGRPWPADDEFRVGCTLEHAAYYLSWLVAFFGSVTKVTTFPACLVESKNENDIQTTPDFSVACLEFESGVVARLTCSIYADHNHVLSIFGDDGKLSIDDCWYYDAPVHFEPFSSLSPRLKKIPLLSRLRGVHPRKVPLAPGPGVRNQYRTRGHRMDFCRGIAEMADAVKERRDSRLAADFSLHINEVVLKIQSPLDGCATQHIESRVEPMQPMPWAESDHTTANHTNDQQNQAYSEQSSLVATT